jgi:hypothetical protein
MPPTSRRRLLFRRCPATAGLPAVLACAALASASIGCAAEDTRAREGGDAGADVPAPRNDGGPAAFFDAASAADAGYPPGADGAAPGTPSETDSFAGARGCYDFADSDSDGAPDCDDTDCAVTPICCVGSSAPGCCAATAGESLDLATCSGGLAACTTDAIVFGSPTPEVVDGALIPNGADRFDSGLVLGREVDPRVERVRIAATIRHASEPCIGCIDWVAVGLVAGNAAYDATTRVVPDVALVVNNADRRVLLVVGDAVVASIGRTELEAILPERLRDASALPWELSVAPDGAIAVAIEGAVLMRASGYAPSEPARIAIYGRTTNRGPTAPTPASVASIAFETSVCDAPASVARTSATILPETASGFWVEGDAPSDPSVVTWQDAEGEWQGAMVFELEGRIHHALSTSEGRFRSVLDPHAPSNVVLAGDATIDWRARGVSEPELVRGANEWVIFFTAHRSDGRTAIGRATGAPGFAWSFPTISLFLTPEEDSATTTSLDGPTHLLTDIDGVRRELLALRRRVAESSDAIAATVDEIVLYDLTGMADGAAPARAGTVLDPAAYGAGEDGGYAFVHRARTERPVAFDSAEIAAPSLIAYRGVLRLYYAGRRGTRWAIGMLISADGVYWRHANEGAPILSGSGAGFDALSVAAPDVVLDDGRLRLYYTGHDGARTAIGLASHAVADGGS